MLITFALLCVFTVMLSGYAFLGKYILLINHKNKNKNENYDFIFGILIVGTLSIVLNFFFKLSYFFEFVIILGLTLFLISIYKYKNNINYLSLFFFLFLFTFISYDNGLVYDSPLYHQQNLKYHTDSKIIFGMINLEPRYAMVSLWQSFIAIFSRNLLTFNPAYLLSLIPFSFLCNHVFSKRNENSLSNNFLFFCLFVIFLFAILHPFKDGIMLNALGSPETDIVPIVFIVFSFYFFLRFIAETQSVDLIYLILFSLLAMFSKINNLPLIFLVIYCLFLKYNFKTIFTIHIKENYAVYLSIFFISMIWIIKNIIISGCLVFPVSFTCLDVDWADVNVAKYHTLEAISWNRDTELRANSGNFDFTIYSYDWFIPWVKGYLFKVSILQMVLVSFGFLSLSFLYKIIMFSNNFKLNHFSSVYLFFLPLSLLIFFQSPEVRYFHGLFISIISFNTLITFKNIFTRSIKINLKVKTFILIFLIIILSLKNYSNFNLLFKDHQKKYDYSNIKLIGTVNGFKIFAPDFNTDGSIFCFDFKGICVYKNVIDKDRYYPLLDYRKPPIDIVKRYNYIFVIDK